MSKRKYMHVHFSHILWSYLTESCWAACKEDDGPATFHVNHRIVFMFEWLSADHLVQPSAQSSTNFKVRSGCSGPYPVDFCKSLKMKVPQPLWTTCSSTSSPSPFPCWACYHCPLTTSPSVSFWCNSLILPATKN